MMLAFFATPPLHSTSSPILLRPWTDCGSPDREPAREWVLGCEARSTPEVAHVGQVDRALSMTAIA